MEAESNREIRLLIKRIGKLDAENSGILAKIYKFETRCSRLRQSKKNDLVRIKKLESQIEQLHVVTRDNPLFIIPTKRTNLKKGARVGATVLGKIDRQHVYTLRMHNGRYGRLHISQIFDGNMYVDIFNRMLKPGDHVYAEIESMIVHSPTESVYNLAVRASDFDMTTNRHLSAAIEECCERIRRDG